MIAFLGHVGLAPNAASLEMQPAVAVCEAVLDLCQRPLFGDP